MKSVKLPLSVWAYVGGIVLLGIAGSVINHIEKKKRKSKK